MTTSLIYTIGRRDIYEPYIASDPSAAKAKGGSVWRTRDEALHYLSEHLLYDYWVYGVVARWDEDTEVDPGATGYWRALTKDAYLIGL